MYDRGAPDYKAAYPDEERELLDGDGKPTGEMGTYQRPKDLKWRIVCAGVQRLIEKEGLDEADVMLWFDWQSSALHGSSNPRTAVPHLARCSRLLPVPTAQFTRTIRPRSSTV